MLKSRMMDIMETVIKVIIIMDWSAHMLAIPANQPTGQPASQWTYADWSGPIHETIPFTCDLFHAKKIFLMNYFQIEAICISLPPSLSCNNRNNQANSIAKSSHLFSSLERSHRRKVSGWERDGGGGILGWRRSKSAGQTILAHLESVKIWLFVFNLILNLWK